MALYALLQKCGKLKSCTKRGLHSHHPRDCLFYLRDLSVEELQKFLQEGEVNFDENPPREQVEEARKNKQKEEGVVVEAGNVAES